MNVIIKILVNGAMFMAVSACFLTAEAYGEVTKPGLLQQKIDKLKVVGLYENDAVEFGGQPLPPGIARSWEQFHLNGNTYAIVPFPGFDPLMFIGQWEYLGRNEVGDIVIRATYKIDFTDPTNLLGNPECVAGPCVAYSVVYSIIRDGEFVSNVGGIRYTADNQTFLGYELPSVNRGRKIDANAEIEARFEALGGMANYPSIPDASDL